MKTSPDHLLIKKQAELRNVVKIIRVAAKVEMVLLFGSYTRGDFVDCDFRYDAEEGHFTSYESDFDVMVITDTEEKANNVDIWYKVEKLVRKNVSTPVSLVIEEIGHVNEQLSNGRYFYSDIKKEGIVIYDSKRFHLSKAKKLNDAMRKKLAEEDRDIWFTKAKEFSIAFDTMFQKKFNNNTAFQLHQTTEALLSGTFLVLTGYKPRTHDLEKLVKQIEEIEPAFSRIFPRREGEEKRLFELLRKAYVDARYKKSYKITKEELEYLAGRVKKLRSLALRKCREKIVQYV